MFVGDSMTVGRAGDGTWRYWMWRHLRQCAICGGDPHTSEPRGTESHAAEPRGTQSRASEPRDTRSRDTASRRTYDIVGPWTSQYTEPHTRDTLGNGADTGGAPREAAARTGELGGSALPPSASAHLAAWGEGWQHMARRVRAAVAGCRPDVLLISLGLIDLGFYTNSAQTDAYVREFFAEARAAGPRTRAVVLPVVPNIRALLDAGFAAEVERFNELLSETLAALSLPGSPLVLAAPPVAYDVRGDTYDGTHPAASGERKLAAAFADALHGLHGPHGSHGPLDASWRHPVAQPASVTSAPADATAPAPPAAVPASGGSTGARVSRFANVESV
jgi:lysophospholipase L1-like esterase